MKRARFVLMAIVSLSMLFLSTSCGILDRYNSDRNDSDKSGLTVRELDSIGLYPAQVSYVGDKEWGYINDVGVFEIKPVFDEAYDFQQNGLAVAGVAGKVGLIDKSGSFVVTPQYSSISDFREDRAITQSPDGFRAIDKKGTVIFGPVGFIGNFFDGRAVFYKQDSNGKLLYGYIDLSGNVVIKPKYEYANDFSNGLATARLVNGGFALLDRDGKELRTFKYYSLGNYSNGLLAYQEKQDGKYGYINEKGTIMIKPQFTYAMDFKEGRAVVNVSQDPVINKYGLIDTKGKFIVNPEYNDILILGEGMLALGVPINNEYSYIGSRYAVASDDGKRLTDFNFYGVDNYNEELTSVYDNQYTFFLDRNGKRVTNLPTVEGSGTLDLLNNLVKVFVDRRLYYIDRNGDVIYKPSDCASLEIGVTVCEIKYKPNRNYLVYYPKVSDLADKEVENNINTRLQDMSIKTGIKPEDELDYSYDGDFSITFSQKNLLELELNGYNYPFGAAHGMPTMKYVQINIKSGRFYELKDLFKKDSNYVKVLSDIVGLQIKEHGEEMGIFPDTYKGISADQPFFITKDALNLYFEPYEIAPYAAGFPTFTIPFEEINGIINKEGGFWLSFN